MDSAVTCPSPPPPIISQWGHGTPPTTASWLVNTRFAVSSVLPVCVCGVSYDDLLAPRRMCSIMIEDPQWATERHNSVGQGIAATDASVRGFDDVKRGGHGIRPLCATTGFARRFDVLVQNAFSHSHNSSDPSAFPPSPVSAPPTPVSTTRNGAALPLTSCRHSK
jgi:hypothetical protein